MKKEKKEKNRGLDLGGLGARRGKKKVLGKGMRSESWYTGPGAHSFLYRSSGANEENLTRNHNVFRC